MKSIFGPAIEVMGKALNLRAKRNGVISSNIANVDTPGYKARDLNFNEVMDSYLKEQMPSSSGAASKEQDLPLRTTDPRHITPRPKKVELDVEISTERGVPNNVDLDEEMAKLSENNIQYQMTTQMLIKKFEMLKTAITEGGKQ